MIFRKIKYFLKRRFFKLLSILIGIIILIAPFSVSAKTVDFNFNNEYRITDVRMFIHGSDQSVWFDNFTVEQMPVDGSNSLSFEFSSGSLPNGNFIVVLLFDILSEVDSGTSVNLSFDSRVSYFNSNYDTVYCQFVNLSNFPNYIGYNDANWVPPSYSSNNTIMHYSIDIPISEYQTAVVNSRYSFAANLSNETDFKLVLSNFKLKGGYSAPDGSAITDYENAESSLISGAQEDFTSVESQAQTSAMARIRHHLNAFQAVTAMFDGFILDSPDFSALLWISLSLAILAVLLGVAFSAASSFSRSKGRDDV